MGMSGVNNIGSYGVILFVTRGTRDAPVDNDTDVSFPVVHTALHYSE